ncbi:formate dehydrogenase subunit beta [Paracoccus sediminis]|uniref:Formate dehydrogenase (Quinone-dependent) iron-sulfur subunit n=1 Tax=Paracoccus sediminis TaxID=1214787 RepID=A0A238XIH7_9RHOB|nr:formate dehydrogenase subunit beta [Paracoccus sediminis]TBN48519.1 formate dehydrogenase subunit beta [Paracoccus sediminis]SNR58371.1 formate dehydrogenase (quinone-dependent) iron-sulfur subunit [Paracoccus sediminis]
MSETAPQPVTAASNPPVQPIGSNLLPSDVVRISATKDVPQPDRQLTKVAKLIDVSKCIGCKACQSACIEWNDTRPEVETNVGVYENPHDLTPNMFTLMRFAEWVNPETDNLEWLIRKDGCMHCEDPGCLKACPAPGAIVQYSNGIVDFVKENCIGCGYCVTGCPFDIPRISKVDHKSYKCTLCSDRVAVGQGPACAKACPTQAIVFGTKDDMIAHANERIEDLKSRGYDNAGIYDPAGVGGTHVIYVLHHADKPSIYNDLPDDPRISPVVEGWKGVTKTAGLAVMGVAAVGAALHGIFSRGNRVDEQEEEAAERLVKADSRDQGGTV